ncbi:MAG: hypothetical protein PVS3B2_13740 [Candidatus Dormibacteraceae bacterium]
MVVREERAVPLVEGQGAAACLEGVKGHALTAYQDRIKSTVGPLLIEAFRYNRWANLHLLDVCSKLPAEQLDLTAPGTYGTIAGTWHHLLAAEQRYLTRLGAEEPQLNETNAFPGLEVLREHAARSGDQLIEAAGRVTPDDFIDTKYGGETSRLHLGVVIIQALHHGNDHRTHICGILGHHQLPYGDMDVWAYGDATGAIVTIA